MTVMIRLQWIKVTDQLPEKGRAVLITDGIDVGMAKFYDQIGDYVSWDGCGFSGAEWDWEFLPDYWAYLNIELPKGGD